MGHGILFYFVLVVLAVVWSMAGGASSYVQGVLNHVDDTGLPFQQIFSRTKLLANMAAGLYLGTAGSLVAFVGFRYLFDSYLSIPDITILSIIGGSSLTLKSQQIYRRLAKRLPAVLANAIPPEQLLDEKLTLLRSALIIETRPEEKMRLRALIKETESGS